MYRYTDKTRGDYISVFRKLREKERLYLPYHVCWEFFENRLTVLNSNKKHYWTICKSLKNELDKIRKIKNHPKLNLEDIEEKLQIIIDDIEEQEEAHPDYNGEKDMILEEIVSIFEWSIWVKPTPEYTEKTEKEWSERYKKKIPPWFEDEKKTSNKYGDYFVWKEILEKWKESKKSIVFITDDNKKDWWLFDDWKTIMPQPSLRKELLEYAEVCFHMYTPEKFLDHINDNSLNEDITFNIDEDTIAEVKEVWSAWSRNITSNPEWIIINFKNLLQEVADKTTFQITDTERGEIIALWNDLSFTKKDEDIDLYELLAERIKLEISLINGYFEKYSYNSTVRQILSTALLELKQLLRDNSIQKSYFSFQENQILPEETSESNSL